MDNDIKIVNYGFVDENNILQHVFTIQENDFTTIDRLKNDFNSANAYPMNFEKEVADIGRAFWNGQRFVPPSPFPSWIFDDNVNNWIPPIPVPDSGNWKWNEDIVNWEELDSEDLSQPEQP